ncbi:hypothetical protein L4174_023620 (plasmid) [Photobacterium sp. CCB-ST2H9]|uniref:hypothetical protein n=1 Tax=Photobacterium sp. CCB-ST2H9 TaxID=2912855 RepID=UPI0020063C38|nr:hypothetical protein [Photobacterium sp. CCB-ST2H9]UTM60458.1 hypothetical protein L4174_023620 [Photobacterium sp. CCB-ST2H9]
MGSVSTKFNVEGEDQDAADRFCDLYNSKRSGKSALINELVSGGMILKESGLIDLVMNLDQDPAFRAAPNTQKTRMLLAELSQLFSGVAGSAGGLERPVVKHSVTASHEPAQESEPEPAPVRPPQQKLPNFGM